MMASEYVKRQSWQLVRLIPSYSKKYIKNRQESLFLKVCRMLHAEQRSSWQKVRKEKEEKQLMGKNRNRKAVRTLSMFTC